MDSDRRQIAIPSRFKNPLPAARPSRFLGSPPPSTKQRLTCCWVQAGTSKGNQKLKGGGEDDEAEMEDLASLAHPLSGAVFSLFTKGESKDKHTKLIKEHQQNMSAFALCYAAWKESQAMSPAEKRKYGAGMTKGKGRMQGDGEDEAGTSNRNERLKGEGEDEAETSKGNQRLKGGGEDDLGVQNKDPRSIPKEELKDKELLIPIHRAEKGWPEHLGSVVSCVIKLGKFVAPYIVTSVVSCVIKLGKFVAPYIVTYLLSDNVVKKFDGTALPIKAATEAKVDGTALQIKAANEAKDGTTASASHPSFSLHFSMFNNLTISLSPRFGWNNREKRGNDVEVSGSK